MPIPDNPRLAPSAYARMSEDARIDLLLEYLDDLRGRLEWVDDEFARHGLCAMCVVGDKGVHDCREAR